MKVNRIQSNAQFSYLNSELIFLKSTNNNNNNKNEGEQNKDTAKIILIATFQGYNSTIKSYEDYQRESQERKF